MENFYQALNKLLHIISESTRVIEIMNYDIVVICHIRHQPTKGLLGNVAWRHLEIMGRRVQNAHSPCSSNILQIGVLRQGCSWAPIRLCSFIYHKRDLWGKHKSDLTLGNKYVGSSPNNLSLRPSV